MARSFLEWLDYHLLGGREREARERAHRDIEEKRRQWEALSQEEKDARLAKANAEMLASRIAREQEALKDFPLELVIVPGYEPLPTFERLRAEGRGMPVILNDLPYVRDNIVNARHTPKQILARAAKLTHPAGQIKASMESYAEQAADIARGELAPDDEDVFPVGEAPPDDAPMKTPRPVYRVTKDYEPRVLVEQCYIALLPTNDWTEAPAYLNFGGFNACPAPEEHIAAMRSWRDRFGAELVSMSGDIVEFRVARPPRTGAEAMALAAEIYAYCSEGAESMGQIAADLQHEEWWYYWWD